MAIEIDPVLVHYLRAKFRDTPELEIIERDILKTDLESWAPQVVAGNLPYYITSPVIEKVLGLGARLQCAVFLVQKEVAERLTASPGSRDYGFLSVHTQLLANVELLFPVPAAAFRPMPKVDSAVVRLTPRDLVAGIDAKSFLSFASAAFRQKRKTLRNNLLGTYDKTLLEGRPDMKKRAEQLSIGELMNIWRDLSSS